MGSRGSEGWKSNCGGFVAAAFGALWTGSANPTHEMNIRWSEGAVRDFASGEVKAEFRVWGMSSADMKFDAFEDAVLLG